MSMDPTRVPEARQLEIALLGRLLMSPVKGAGSLGNLRPRHFFDRRHRILFQVVRTLRKEGCPHDLMMVLQRLQDRGELEAAGEQMYVASLLDNAGTNPDLTYYVTEILRKARDRALVRVIPDLDKHVMASTGAEGEERLASLINRVNRIGRFELRPRTKSRPEVWKQEDLMGSDFLDVKWVVDDVVPDGGVAVLGGKKKIGKSWFCLQVAQAVAAGARVLDKKTEQGSVVYICLEDGPARLQRRLTQQHARAELPITYRTRFTPLDQGGLDELRHLAQATRPRLIIIDTLAAAKTGKVDENAAGPMADLFNGLRAIAQDCQVGILVVAHHGKFTTGDPGHDIRGSSATPGAADLNIGLYKENGVHLLRTEGRDIGEAELRVKFDAVDTWSWHLLGDAREMARTEAEEEIRGALEELGPADAGRIAKHLGKKRPGVQKILKRLREQKKIPFTNDEKDSGKIIYGPWEPPSK